MNKPLVIVLVVIILLLAVYALFIQNRDPEGAQPTNLDQPPKPAAPKIDGVETTETPEFDVTVEVVRVGAQQRLKFTMAETHGWAVVGVYVHAHYGAVNAETGQFETTMQRPAEMLCKGNIDFGKPLVEETTLTDAELAQIGGDAGTNENWQGAVYKWTKVYKPKGS